MSKIISKEQIKEALDNSIEGVSETPGYMEKFAREIEKAVIKSVYESAAQAVISDLRAELERADEQIAKLEMDARYFHKRFKEIQDQSAEHRNRIESGVRVYAKKQWPWHYLCLTKSISFNATLMFDEEGE